MKKIAWFISVLNPVCLCILYLLCLLFALLCFILFAIFSLCFSLLLMAYVFSSSKFLCLAINLQFKEIPIFIFNPFKADSCNKPLWLYFPSRPAAVIYIRQQFFNLLYLFFHMLSNCKSV